MKFILLLLLVSCASSKPERMLYKPSAAVEQEIQSYVKQYLKDPNYSSKITKEANDVVISVESSYSSFRGYCMVTDDIRELVLNIKFWRHGSPEYRYKMVAHGLTQCLYYPRNSRKKFIRRF